MVAAFFRTAWGSRLNDDPAKDIGAKPARAAVGRAVAAAFWVSVGAAAVVGGTAGMLAVSLAWAARFRSAARAAARVVGAAVVRFVGVVGGGVEISEAGSGMNGPLSWARRRPVGLVRSRATWARRG
ncbi:hypothetical protein [Arthrobacter sp. FW306-04-A]|uniref:hypothetical protein n=1 Tax=Arthrobacter sp. FW306-04-A TaxID=2879619 RepID=UPI0037BEAC3A|nr:hypothetical protein LFT43_19300 [Arthrobacter sp. FW306-04-A]